MPRIIKTTSGLQFEVPDDWSDDQVREAIKRKKKQQPADTTAVAAPDTTTAAPLTGQGQSMLGAAGQSLLGTARGVNKMMPQIGGSVGAALGGVAGLPLAAPSGGTSVLGGAVGGGMLGAGAGRAVEQQLARVLGQAEEVPSSPMQAYGQQAMSAAGAGVPFGIERFVARHGPVLAEKLAEASIRNGFGDPTELAQTMLQYGVKNTRAGLQHAQRLVTAFRGAHNQQIAEAARNQGPLWNSTRDVLEPAFAPIHADLEASAFPGAGKKALKTLEGEFQEFRHQAAGRRDLKDMDVAQLNRMKELADNMLRRLYRAQKVNPELQPQRDMEERGLQAISDRARTLMYGDRDASGVRRGGAVEFLHDLEERQARLLALRENIGPQARKELGAGPSLIQRTAAALPMGAAAATFLPGGTTERVGAGLAGAAGGAALSSPQALSLMALIANNPSLGPLLAQIYRGGAAATDVLKPRPKP